MDVILALFRPINGLLSTLNVNIDQINMDVGGGDTYQNAMVEVILMASLVSTQKFDPATQDIAILL